MLCDTGPLVAIVDRKDPHHAACVTALRATGRTASHGLAVPNRGHDLLRRAGGLEAQNELWSFLTDGFLKLTPPDVDDWRSIHLLLNQYADMPLDFADASLVVTAARLNDWKLFTIDRRLGAIRLANQHWVEVIP